MDQLSQNIPTQNINNNEYGAAATITNVAGPLLDNTQEKKKRNLMQVGLGSHQTAGSISTEYLIVTLILQRVNTATRVPTSSRFNLQACRRAVYVFVVLDEQPFKAIEGEGFKYLCKTLQPQFTIPSRRTIARGCFQLYLDEKLKLKAFFKSNCNRVALTTDCWTSIQNLNYLTLTSHFVDNEWNYQKRIISFTVIPNHKGVTVGKKIEEVLKD
uniref:Zinc finger BED domain-containing protein RICESLEEPER 2-like n=1 Tax=Cicer arietinum TaxID=3827 RepID=A0A1S2Z6X0_CICAR|nr:zinc finger BED domain-containing protein RICESLEEPER 2-like [Cicer arietinum]